MIVNAKPAIFTQPVSQTLCMGSTAVFSVAANGSGLTYQWKKDGIVLSDTGKITGSNTTTLTIANIDATYMANYSVEIKGVSPCDSVISSDALLTVVLPVTISQQPIATTICAGLPVSLTVTAAGAGITYQWYKGDTVYAPLVNNTNITGVTTNTLLIDQVSLSDSGYYYVMVNGIANCASIKSDSIYLTVRKTISIITQPLSQNICNGSNIVLTASATANGDSLSYQWRKNIGGIFVNITGADQPTYTILAATVTDAGIFDLVVTSVIGECTTVYTTKATIIVSPTSIGGSVDSSKTVCSSANTGTLTLTGNTGEVIGWEYSTDEGSLWIPISNTTTSLIYNNLSIATWYRAALKSGVCDAINSSIAIISINQVPDAFVTPGNQTICSDSSIASTAVTGSMPSTIYNWTRNETVNILGIPVSGTGDITGVLSNTTANPISVTFTFIPSTAGCTGAAITSVVTVNPTPITIASISNQTICAGNLISNIELSSATIGATYAWTRDQAMTVTGIASSGNGTSISGALTNTTDAPITVTFTITPTANGCVGTPIVATVIVNPTPIAAVNLSTQAICSGSNITTLIFTGNMASTNFYWSRNNTSTVSGIAASDSGNISGILTNATNAPVTVTIIMLPVKDGCTGAAITTTIVVNPIPVATVTNDAQQICSGNTISNIEFSSATLGTTYTWERDNTLTVTGIAGDGESFDIAGSLTNTTNTPITVTFSITPNANGCSGSNAFATVIVNPVPNAVVNLSTQTICSGSNISALTFTGNIATTNFNWLRNNSSAVTGIAASGSGNISGILTNTTSAPVTVTFSISPSKNGCTGAAITTTIVVNPIPVAILSNSAQQICSGNTISNIEFSSATLGTTYTWERDNTLTVTGIAGDGESFDIAGSLTNTTNTPITVTFSITPNANGCSGANAFATVIVNPVPTVAVNLSSQTICSGNNISTLILSGILGPTTYNWIRNNTVAVTGMAASGTGNIAGMLTNATAAPVTVNFSIVPVAFGCTGTGINATVVVNPLSVGGSTSANATVCASLNSGTITLSGHTGNIIRWESSINNGISWISIANTTINHTYTNLTQTTIYRAVLQSGLCNTANSSTTTITVNAVPIGGSISAGNTVCVNTNGAALTLSGQTGSIIRWESSTNAGVTWNTISNTTTTQNYLNLTQTTIYRAVLQNGVCALVYSGTATITVNPLPSISPAVAATNVCFSAGSQTSSLNYTSILNGANQYSITWNASPANSFVAVANAVLPVSPISISVPANTVAGTYTGIISVRNSTTGCIGVATNFTITVNATSVGGTVSSSATVCAGSNSNTLSLTGNTGTIVRWEFSTNGGTVWSSIVNTTSSQSYNNLTLQTIYRAVVQSGVCPSANSSTATISINPLPTITTALTTANRCFNAVNNQTTTLAYSATANLPTTYSISWNASPANSLAAVTNAVLATSPISIAVPSNTPAGTYTGTITVRNANGCTSSPANTFTLTVNPLPVVSMAADYCTVPGKVVLTATPSPAGTYTYLWAIGGTNPSIEVDIAGSYSVDVTNINGCKTTGVMTVNTELATNGNFDLGNTGFTTGYVYVNNLTVNGLFPEGRYTVNNNPNINHSNFWGIDHTTGTGNMMIVNGVVGPTVWQNNITVQPNTTYYFAAWALSVNNAGNYAILQFSINGTPIGASVQLAAGVNNNANNKNWQRFYGTWNSGAATSAACSIVDLVSAAGGNDFALDDISISTLSPYVKLTSAPATALQTLCKNSSITNIVYAVGGNGSDPIVVGLPTGISTSFNGISLIFSGVPTVAGVYNYTVTSPGCTPVTLGGQIIVQEQTITRTSAVATTSQIICRGSAISNITYNIGGTATGAGVTGLPAGLTGNFLGVIFTIIGTPTVAGTFNYTVTTTGTCTAATAIGTITVNQQTIAPVSLTASQAIICNGGSATISQVGGTLGTGAVWRWYTNAAYTSFLGIGTGATASLLISPTANTTYYLRAEGGSSPCASNVAGPIAGVTITVQQLSANPVSATSSANNFCTGTGTNLTIVGGGGGGTGESIAWYTGSCGGVLVGTGNNVTVFPTVTTIYFGRYENASPCNYTTSCVSVTVNINAAGTWLGINNNWFDVLNWCGGAIPNSTTDVFINGGLSFYPILAAGVSSVKNITIQANASLTVLAAKIQVAGIMVNNGIFNAAAGLIELNGTSASQSISGSLFVNRRINALIIANPFGVNVSSLPNDTLNILDYLSFGNINNAILNTGNNITLNSTALKTARLADITNNGVNIGNNVIGRVVVERFIPAKRSWRMLTVPLKSSGGPTINEAWQEGVTNTNFVNSNNLNPRLGYGMHISGAGAGLGFDPTPLNNPSIRKYNRSTDTWSGIPNTNLLKLTDQEGLLTFVRGNRSTQLSQNVAAIPTSTILRATGQLKTGLQSYSIAASTGSFEIIGNPFASSIDFRRVVKSPNINDGFVVWDPNLTGTYNVGAFQYFIKFGSDYIVFPGSGSFGVSLSIVNSIQSGQAFMIQHSGAGTIDIGENAKISTSESVMFKPSPLSIPGHVSILVHYLEADNATTFLIDGALELFNDDYNNAVDIQDFKKVGNISENLSIVNKDVLLSIEKRLTIVKDDTIQLKFTKVKLRKYRFTIDINDIKTPGTTAFLEDIYLKKLMPLSTVGATNYDFNIINVPSSSDPLRFRIIFKVLSTLPVKYIHVAASVNQNNIKVSWKVANQLNMVKYEVERSLNGIDFLKITSTNARNENNAGVIDYDILDRLPLEGINFYRVKGIGLNGEIQYSDIVKANFAKNNNDIAIYPNPVLNGQVNLQMQNLPLGTYAVRFFNDHGQLIYSQQLQRQTSDTKAQFALGQLLVAGKYYVEIVNPDQSFTTLKFISQ